MKNKLSDLNNHLFAQLERLSDEELTPDQIEQEAARADAIVSVSDQIISGASLQLKAADLVAKHGRGIANMIPEAVAGKVIEHRPEPPRKEIGPEDEARAKAEAEAETIAKRRALREREEERMEWERQKKEENAAAVMPSASLNLGLTKTESDLVIALAKKAGNAVSKDSLMFALYGHENDQPEAKILDVRVSNIRKKLADSSFEIETVWGVGYIFRGDPAPFLENAK